MISRFERDSTSSGLNYEKIANAKDPKMRSLRIDGGYRAIVLKPAVGDVHMLLWADKHDDAYHWAERHACSINAETGALQIYEPRQIDEQTVESTSINELPIFGELKPRELIRLGVPSDMTGEVLEIRTESALEEMVPRLPTEAYDALYLFMAGENYEQIIRDRETLPETVDTMDFAAALGRNDTRSRFVVIDNDLELEEMFNAPLEHWRVFLHASQRRLVEHSWNGPVRVLGGAGTGKTVVAMHRARWLARALAEGERILFTTFTRNLAGDIENNMRGICTPEEMSRIEVTNLDRWVQRFLRGKSFRFKLTFNRDRNAWLHAMSKKSGELPFADSFYSDEWEQVIQANSITTRNEYLRVSRTGRGIRLNRAVRARIWPVFEEYRAQLAEQGIMEVADCYRAAAALLEQDRANALYTSVIVDEAQDMSAPAWRLIRSIAPSDANDLFIVGDAHQRIYSRHQVVLSRCGIDIRGRGRKLRLNYRTTEETRRWADLLLEECAIDDLDGGSDDTRGTRSIAHGPPPQLKEFESRDEQATWLVNYLTSVLDQDEPLRGICIVARTRQERDAIHEELSDADLPVEVLEADSPDDSTDGVRLATMHRVKGLEFDRMVIASANADTIPMRFVLDGTEGLERDAAETAELALLYVAATRAKKELTILSVGDPSPFLK